MNPMMKDTSRRFLDETQLPAGRNLHRSPSAPGGSKKTLGSALYYKSSRGTMNSGNEFGGSRHETPSSKNATWGDVKNMSNHSKMSLLMKSSPSKSSSTSAATATHINGSWPLPQMSLSSRVSCHGKVESSSFFSACSSSRLTANNHKNNVDKHMTQSAHESAKRLEQGIEELLVMLQSSSFVGTVDPEFHAPYLEALNDFGSKLKKDNKIQQHCPLVVEGDESSMDEDGDEDSFAGDDEDSQEDVVLEPKTGTATESSSISSPSSATKRHITNVYDAQHRLSPALKRECLEQEVKRLRSVLTSPKLEEGGGGLSIEERRERWNESFGNLHAMLAAEQAPTTETKPTTSEDDRHGHGRRGDSGGPSLPPMPPLLA